MEPSTSEENRLERARREKVDALRARGVEPYPWTYPGRAAMAAVRDEATRLSPGAEDPTRPRRIAGRLRALRAHGRTSFLDLEDQSGALQVIAREDALGTEAYRSTLDSLDPGDIVGADGVPAVSNRGEPSLVASNVTLLAKAIAPPPEKYHGLRDAEERLRRRYAELLSSPEIRTRFQVRSQVVREIRAFFDAEGFQESETPVLVPVASGAAAEPFVTQSRYLGAELHLRIALELALKRLLVGGFERVFELGHCFRNEDLDSTHSPEFTMLEAYWAYADYVDMRGLVERLFTRLGARVAEWWPDSESARTAARWFQPPYPTLDFVDELERRSGIARILERTPEELRGYARSAGATVPDDSPPGKFLEKLFEHYVEPTLDRPTFVLDHPVATTPLAKRHRSKAGRVERFEVFARGFELGNAYTELNDPDEQERRFRAQGSGRGAETYAYDEDFVRALRYGMPPASGVGLGVDRLVMALTGIASIKDVVLFPMTRREPAR